MQASTFTFEAADGQQVFCRRWAGTNAPRPSSGNTEWPGLESCFQAADQPSELFAAMFAGFNAPFDGPDASGFEWLSRDEGEVAKYAGDPDCGEPLSNGFVADMLSGSATMWQHDNEARITRDLPVYLFSGENDPVGGEKAASVLALATRYAEMGIGPVTLRVYADGRHEMLNETNRHDVHHDLLNWLATLDVPPAG